MKNPKNPKMVKNCQKILKSQEKDFFFFQKYDIFENIFFCRTKKCYSLSFAD